MILLESVIKNYRTARGTATVLQSLGAHVKSGEFAAVLGRSGSGKSTLLHLLAGLDREFQGSARVCGRYLEKLSDYEAARLRGRRVGLVLQTPVFPPHLNCADNLAMAARFADADPSVARIRNILDKLNLAEYMTAYPDELSGGQLQRMAVARALIGQPELLLCDEPTGNLDTRTGADLIDWLSGLNQDGLTVLVATHDERVAKRADRVLLLDQGVLTEVTA